jgi:rfaE bifunctional protein kinase chain/domain
MKADRFQEITSRFASQTVLVIGDLMLDSYLWGIAERISPEAPVPVIHVQRMNHNPGGAGNVALNLARLTAQTLLMGIVGEDTQGEKLIACLEQEGIRTTGVVIDPSRPTTVKTRVIAQDQQVVRVDQESNDPVGDSIHQRLLEKLAEILPECDAVILEDYNKGLLTTDFITAVGKAAKEAKVPLYVDPKRENFFAFKSMRLFKPNLHEFAQAIGSSFSQDQFEEHGLAMRSQIQAELLLVTRGADGLSLFTTDGHRVIPTKARHVHDVSGAGDTVISTFTLADLAGAAPEEAALLANYAAGRVCEEVGVVPITLEMLAEIVEHHNRHS